MTKGAKNKVILFKQILHELFQCLNKNIFEIVTQIEEKTGMVKKLKEDVTEENINRLENIGELFNSIKLFSMRKQNNTLFDFINEVSLDENNHTQKTEDKDYVSLMTIHQSKGLEFPHIYILGLENGLFPSEKSTQTQSGIEEERRLLYVAITRAIQKVTISYTLNRFQFGTMINTNKSLFLEEIDGFLHKTKSNSFMRSSYNQMARIKTMKTTPPKLNNTKLKKIKNDNYQDSRNLKPGQNILHNIFGEGEIKKVDHNDGNEKIIVLFKTNGSKTLLTKFAKFEIIT